MINYLAIICYIWFPVEVNTPWVYATGESGDLRSRPYAVQIAKSNAKQSLEDQCSTSEHMDSVFYEKEECTMEEDDGVEYHHCKIDAKGICESNSDDDD